MRLSGLAGFCILLCASQSLVGCGDDDGSTPGFGGSSGDAGSSSGSGKGGKASAGETGKSGSATGGTFSTAGTFSSAGTDSEAGENAGGTATAGTGGSGGSGGTGVVPACTTNAECVDTDTNPCTDYVCKDGDCVHTNNTVTCDDGNECTSTDTCTDGVCKGLNNTVACDDLSACTTADKCFGGVCNGTRNLVACPSCLDPNNIIQNCDFSNGTDQWHDDYVFDGASATQTVVNGRLVLDVVNGGPNVFSVQPRQSPILIKKGMKYKIRMIVGSSVDRDIVIGLTQEHAPYTVYSTGDNAAGGFTLHLTKQMKEFEFDFTMTADDDPISKLELKIGGATGNPSTVYFDDIAVIEVKCGNDAACNDGNECTADACDVAKGTCSWTNTTAACTADASDCTNDVCAAGVCTHPKLVDDTACATDGDDCTADVCTAGACTHTFDTNVCACQKDLDCNDNNACTDDTCSSGACVNTNNTAVCDDNNACTSTDVCAAGVCGGVANANACDDGNVCTVPDACAVGACAAGPNVCFDCTTVVGNLLTNCDLSAPLDNSGWIGDLFFNGAAGDQSIKNGELALHITNGGGATYQVQPRQVGLVLVKGTTYVVQFNARATMNRNIDFSITQDGGGFAPYAGAHTFALTPQMGAYTFEFTMTADPPAEKVKYEFDLGGAPNTGENTVFLDNLSLAPKP